MKRYLPILGLFFFFGGVPAAAQDKSPMPTPRPADDKDVVKISTTLIQLDVTVTDSKGKIVTDLSPDEVEIYENGKRQDITNFSFVSNQRDIVSKGKKDETPGKKGANLPPPAPLRQENVR